MRIHATAKEVMAKPVERGLARQLRAESGLPIKQIAAILGVSVGTVSVWVRDVVVAGDHAAEQHRLASLRRGNTWRELSRGRRMQAQRDGRGRAREHDPIHQAGCMLYWAEGAKSRNCLVFANSDVEMVKFFASFLRRCLGFTDDRFTVRLNVYLGNGLSLRQIEDHWLTHLELPRSCLRKHCVNHFPTSSSGRRLNRLPYGVCTLRGLRSTYDLQHIYGAIQEYAGFTEPRWLDGI